jgi:hypothetical protein
MTNSNSRANLKRLFENAKSLFVPNKQEVSNQQGAGAKRAKAYIERINKMDSQRLTKLQTINGKKYNVK